MPVHVEKLEAFTYNDYTFDPLWVILDEHSAPPLLPLLFTTNLSRFGCVYDARELSDETYGKRTRTLIPRDISDSTIRSYVYKLEKFLSYLEECKKTHDTPGAHFSSACRERFVNDYLNRVLPMSVHSLDSLNVHRSALVAYFNWLHYLDLSPRLDLRIFRKTRQEIAQRSNKQHYIQYVSRDHRTRLLVSCTTLAEKLMMRMGFEVGLRSSELMGLRVDEENELVSLFEQLENKNLDHVEQFRYWLHGRYTKGGKSRWIYFNRTLLIDMKRYFDTERQWLINQSGKKDTCFFLRTDKRFKGTGIGPAQGTNVFKRRGATAGLNPLAKFHDLRHTFATELFHAELDGPDGRETRSESAALIVVSQRLGHEIGRNGHASPSTTRYIRMRLEMKQIEEGCDA